MSAEKAIPIECADFCGSNHDMFIFRDQMFALFTSDSEMAAIARTVFLANFFVGNRAQPEFSLCKLSSCGGGREISILYRACFYVVYCGRRQLLAGNCLGYGTFWGLDCTGT